MTEQRDNNPNPIHTQTDQISTVSFYSFNIQDALSHLRMIGPAHHLGLEVIMGVENGQVFIDRAALGDVIVLQRDFPYAIEAYESILTQAHEKHIPVILDLDDLLFELPEYHPDRLKHIFTGKLLPTYQALLEVDFVTVSTKSLGEYVLDTNKNVMVLPNFLDDKIWQLKPPLRKTGLDEKIIIGYMGGLTHQSDLAMILPVFRNLIRRFPDRLEFHFWGTQPPGEFSAYPFVPWHDQITWHYPDFAAYFQTQSADIFVAPLVNNTFNKSKSSIKYLEYGSMGVPGVFSQVAPYSEVITHGENGFLASTAEEWEICLAKLIEDPELRYSLATNAQADIRYKWLLSKNAPLWLAAYQKACQTGLSKQPDDSPHHKMIKNLAYQTVSGNRYTQQQLELQKNTIAELKDSVAQLEHRVAQKEAEISGITNSKTWKLALAFRRIRELIAPPTSRRAKVLVSIFGIFSKKNTTEKI